MSTYRLWTYGVLAATAVLSVITGPAMAQQVIYEPGYCAFFYPNANCQNKGPGNPYTDSNYQRNQIYQQNRIYQQSQNAAAWNGDQTVSVARKRTRTHATHMQ
jgi:hypothetical protein